MTDGITYCGKALTFEAGETVLDCLLRHGHVVASSCRSGVCQSCILQSGTSVPAAAQRGLKPSLVKQGFFLACQCAAQDGLEITSAESLPTYESRVLSATELAPGVFRVLVERPAGLEFRAGQFLNLIRAEDGLTRPYSVASLPDEASIEFHVALLPGGRMGSYLSGTQGAPLLIRGPAGDCFYLEENPEEPLLLAGTGTGLAPLLGVLRAALRAGHRGPIHLFHGAREPSGLYLSSMLRELSETKKLFHYDENVLMPSSVQSPELPPDLFRQVKECYPQLKGFRVYLCGHPEFVQKMRKQCFLAGAAMQAIHSDPFVLAAS